MKPLRLRRSLTRKRQNGQQHTAIKQRRRSAASSPSHLASYCSAAVAAGMDPEDLREIIRRLSQTALLRRPVGTTDSSPTRTATQPWFILVILKRTRTILSVRFERRLNWSQRWLR